MYEGLQNLLGVAYEYLILGKDKKINFLWLDLHQNSMFRLQELNVENCL